MIVRLAVGSDEDDTDSESVIVHVGLHVQLEDTDSEASSVPETDDDHDVDCVWDFDREEVRVTDGERLAEAGTDAVIDREKVTSTDVDRLPLGLRLEGERDRDTLSDDVTLPVTDCVGSTVTVFEKLDETS